MIPLIIPLGQATCRERRVPHPPFREGSAKVACLGRRYWRILINTFLGFFVKKKYDVAKSGHI